MIVDFKGKVAVVTGGASGIGQACAAEFDGDALAAGFISGLLEDWPLEQTIRFASAVGASCTRRLGCTAGVFGREEALVFLAQNHLELAGVGWETGGSSS